MVNPKTKRILKTLLWVFLVIILLLAFAAGILFYVNRFSVVIHLRGESEITVEYGNSYEDPGADAYLVGTLFLKNGRGVEVAAVNYVDTEKVGTYQVVYTAQSLWFSQQAQRTVNIVDTKPPVITLKTSPGSFTIPGEPYEEAGYSATDNYDGDITSRVVREEKDGMVTYTVQDSSGNSATAQRYIIYFDPIPPKLTLLGDAEMTLPFGTDYEEPGYSAMDNCAGDLKQKVTVTGSVNKYCAGTYRIEYRVTDEYGNSTVATRTVTIEPLRQPDVVYPSGKVIYLTFDDGPSYYTEYLLDVLAQYNVKATFFVVNNGHYDTLRRMAREGHSIAVHTATHDYDWIYSSEEAYFSDLNRMHDIIYEQTGVYTTLIRFPGGSSNTVSCFNKGIMTRLTQAVTDMGYQYFDWNVDSNDAGGATSSDEVFWNVVNGIGSRKINIVLQHDIQGFSVYAVERIINWGLSNGYTFLPLDPTSPTAHHGLNN